MPKVTRSKCAAQSSCSNSISIRPSTPQKLFEIRWLEQIAEASYCLSTTDRHYRGKMRVRIQSSTGIEVPARELFQRVGLLPQSPCMMLGYAGRSNEEKAAIEQRWLNILNKPQREAWRGLRRDHRKQYLRTGLITLGVTTPMQSKKVRKRTVAQSAFRVIGQRPLSDAPISYILGKIKEAASEKWDFNAIDWSST